MTAGRVRGKRCRSVQSTTSPGTPVSSLADEPVSSLAGQPVNSLAGPASARPPRASQ